MAERKYDKYIVSGQQPGDPPQSGTKIAWVNDEKFKGSSQYHAHWVYPTPRNIKGLADWHDMSHGPHEHKQPEVIFHIGTDPDNPLDLGGEVLFYLGPEREEHIIDKSCMVFLPAGFIHSPWTVHKVTRPFVIVTVMQECEHTELPHPELCTEEENKHMMYIAQGYDSPERKIILPDGIKSEW